jgi:hypothetical protein
MLSFLLHVFIRRDMIKIVDHIVGCSYKFTAKFDATPNAIYMSPWLWDRVEEEFSKFSTVGGRGGYREAYIVDMRIRVDRALAKNAIRIARQEYINGTPNLTTFEIMYHLPIEEPSKWRRIILN